MAQEVAGELYRSITGQLFEIGRQINQPSGYPFNPQLLKRYLQNVIEGKFYFGNLKSIHTKPFDPAEFIGGDWSTWKGPAEGDGLSGEEDVDLCSLVLSEVEIQRFIFETGLQSRKKSITGEEKLRRLKEKSDFIRFGGNVFIGLWEDYQADKENSVLEWIYNNLKVSFMDFPGLVLRGLGGCRYILCLCRLGVGDWSWSCFFLGRYCNNTIYSVGCASR